MKVEKIVKNLIKNDIAYIKSDPMMWMTLCIPPLTIIGYYVLIGYFDFIVPYKAPLTYLFINIMPMTTGGVLGLRILEEKDQQLLRYYAITLLTLRGYFIYRSILSFVISFIGTTIICIGLMGTVPLLLVVYEALLGVLCTFAMGTIAKNKIQGIVLFKPLNSLILLPCIRLLGDNEYDNLLKIMPWDYSYKILVENSWSMLQYILHLFSIILLGGYLAYSIRVE